MSMFGDIKPFSLGKEHRLEHVDAESEEQSAANLRMTVRRARVMSSTSIPLPTEQEDGAEIVEELSANFEKIHANNDLLSSSFLRLGSTRCDAVCRIVLRNASGVLGYGSGFLVGNGIILTNNHVLPDEASAIASTAEFFYEEGRDPVIVALRPDTYFLTSAKLDYSFVGCALEQAELLAIKPIAISRDPASISAGEGINIIQHPAGRRKEVALRDNQVTSVHAKVVRYRADTEPGSSGSGGFNNQWQLVALHHAGWAEANGSATNEGIRVSAIASDIVNRAKTESRARALADVVLADGHEVSPYLGFFDLAGAGGNALEVEVPDFSGSKDFADIGFWNIEHFNGDVTDERIRDVSQVVQRLSMDVLGLTEVEEPALERLSKSMLAQGDRYAFVVRNASGRQDIAAFYDTDTTTVEIAQDIYDQFGDLLDAKTNSGATAFPRHPLFARCKIFDGNSEQVQFMLIVVHLKAFGDKISQARRRLASEMLAKIIDHIRKELDLPVVLGGDFNEHIDNDVLAALHGAPDLFALTADDASGDAISYVGASHRSLIDHIIVSRDTKLGTIQGDDAAIVRLDQSVADFSSRVSDHVPVVVRLVYRDEPVDGSGSGEANAPTLVAVPENTTHVELRFRN